MEDTYAKLSELEPYAVWPGVVGRVVNGDRLTLAVVDLEPNADVAEHQHDNEQLGLVLKGEITMTIAGASRSLHPGDRARSACRPQPGTGPSVPWTSG